MNAPLQLACVQSSLHLLLPHIAGAALSARQQHLPPSLLQPRLQHWFLPNTTNNSRCASLSWGISLLLRGILLSMMRKPTVCIIETLLKRTATTALKVPYPSQQLNAARHSHHGSLYISFYAGAQMKGSVSLVWLLMLLPRALMWVKIRVMNQQDHGG